MFHDRVQCINLLSEGKGVSRVKRDVRDNQHEKMRDVVKGHSRVLHWIFFVIVAGVFTGVIVNFVELYKVDIASTLTLGLITLFTITITFTVLGVQISSSRYSYRFQDVIARSWTFRGYFALFIIAILSGCVTLILTTPERIQVAGAILIFLTVLSLLSVYSYAQWVLGLLKPSNIITTNISRMDRAYIDEVIASRKPEFNPEDYSGFYLRKTPLELIDDDPLGKITDVALSAVENDDTTTVAQAIQELESQFLSLASEVGERATGQKDNPDEDKGDTGEQSAPDPEYNLTKMKLITWHFLGAFNQLYNKARAKGDDHSTYEVLTAVGNITKKAVARDLYGVPFQTMRYFGRISEELPGDIDYDVVNDVNELYGEIGETIIQEIGNPNRQLLVLGQFVRWQRGFALQAIEQEYYRIGGSAVHRYRSIILAVAREGREIPTEPAICIGIIGEALAEKKAEEYTMVYGAKTDRSYRNHTEDVIVHLTTIKEKIQELAEERDFSYDMGILEEQIERIERRCQPRIDDIHEAISEQYSGVTHKQLTVAWRFIHRNRGQFTKQEFQNFATEDGFSISSDEFEQLMTVLQEIGVVDQKDTDEYTANLLLWDPQKLSATTTSDPNTKQQSH